MMRSLLCTVALFLVVAYAPSVNASRDDEPRVKEGSARIASVCELAHWGHEMAGIRVRVRAEYFTDLHHGAFLSDPRCPSDHLELGVRANDADKSLSVFDEALARHDSYYVGRKFTVDVTGVFGWEDIRIINKELPPDRQLRIPAHGTLSLLKIWSFEKPSQRKEN